MFDAHANLANSLVASPPSPAISGTSLTVTAGQGALFPLAPFNCIVCPANTLPTTSNAEIVRVTAIVGDTFTIERAQENTDAQAIIAGYYIANAETAKTFTDIESAISEGGLSWVSAPASAGASGTAGQIAYDVSFFYVCVATNTWVRAAMNLW